MRIAGMALVAVVAVGGCSTQSEPSASGAFVRLAAVPGRPAAAYFTLHGGSKDATLVSVSTPNAGRAELHESRAVAGGGMTMDSLKSVTLPARGTVTFAPVGKHVMLFDVTPETVPGSKAALRFGFADGTALETQASVIAAGDPPP